PPPARNLARRRHGAQPNSCQRRSRAKAVLAPAPARPRMESSKRGLCRGWRHAATAANESRSLHRQTQGPAKRESEAPDVLGRGENVLFAPRARKHTNRTVRLIFWRQTAA